MCQRLWGPKILIVLLLFLTIAAHGSEIESKSIYNLRVSLDKNFKSLVYNDVVVSSKIEISLNPGQYYWQAESIFNQIIRGSVSLGETGRSQTVITWNRKMYSNDKPYSSTIIFGQGFNKPQRVSPKVTSKRGELPVAPLPTSAISKAQKAKEESAQGDNSQPSPAAGHPAEALEETPSATYISRYAIAGTVDLSDERNEIIGTPYKGSTQELGTSLAFQYWFEDFAKIDLRFINRLLTTPDKETPSLGSGLSIPRFSVHGKYSLNMLPWFSDFQDQFLFINLTGIYKRVPHLDLGRLEDSGIATEVKKNSLAMVGGGLTYVLDLTKSLSLASSIDWTRTIDLTGEKFLIDSSLAFGVFENYELLGGLFYGDTNYSNCEFDPDCQKLQYNYQLTELSVYFGVQYSQKPGF